MANLPSPLLGHYLARLATRNRRLIPSKYNIDCTETNRRPMLGAPLGANRLTLPCNSMPDYRMIRNLYSHRGFLRRTYTKRRPPCNCHDRRLLRLINARSLTALFSDRRLPLVDSTSYLYQV